MHLGFLDNIEIEYKGSKKDCIVYYFEDKYFKLVFVHNLVAINFNFAELDMHFITQVVSKICNYIEINGFSGYSTLKTKLGRYWWINKNHITIGDKVFVIQDKIKIIEINKEEFRYPTLELEDGSIEGDIFSIGEELGTFMHSISGYSKLREQLIINVSIKANHFGVFPKESIESQVLTNEYRDLITWFNENKLEQLIQGISSMR